MPTRLDYLIREKDPLIVNAEILTLSTHIMLAMQAASIDQLEFLAPADIIGSIGLVPVPRLFRLSLAETDGLRLEIGHMYPIKITDPVEIYKLLRYISQEVS